MQFIELIAALSEFMTVRYKLLTYSNPQQRKLAEGKAHPFPLPSNDNLQKERHTHPQKLQPAKGKGSPPVLHIRRSRRSLHKTCHAVVWRLANYGGVLLLCVESLMAGSATGVPMSSWHGGYQIVTPPPYYPKATYATTSYCTEVFKYYTTKAPDLNSTTYAAPSH
ncbi:hypothetical protein DAPPUDRAFT_244504 [Daphnia pulex]|uniref:Uncharacterized protein n=1 Tax=Daphnia pulex TaxID=6669 RepID=E9GL36_DAPPU|nr:hypothetical protein DAPPUDRAFT_244504 [Daphnia pulex]|eukprot:EFX79786.1 hypothetical protein DAPPUDRAFT_244504 [Daphnia pulex]